MLLAIDVGNINTKLGLFAGETILETWRLVTDTRRTCDEYGVLLLGLLGRRLAEVTIDAVVVASVVPRLDPILCEMCERYVGVRPLFMGVGRDVDPGLPVLVDFPEQVGSDRLADVLAGRLLHGYPLITIDLGTATVFNAISSEGAFVGGAIVPGIGTVLENVVQSAAKLPPIPLAPPREAIGRNTVAAMQSGLVYGYVGLVEGLIERFWRELERCPVVATGGHSQLIASQTDMIDRVEPDLTLQGLRLAYELKIGRR